MWPEWLDKLAAAGPAVIFAFLWWQEREERREERAEHKTVSRDMIKSMDKVEATLATFANVFTNRPAP